MSSLRPRVMNRRTLLRGALGWSVAAGLAGVLAACGSSSSDPEDTGSAAPISAGIGGSVAGTARPLYLDPTATDVPLPTGQPTLTAPPSPTATAVPVPLSVLSDWDADLTSRLAGLYRDVSGADVAFAGAADVDLSAPDALDGRDVVLADSSRRLGLLSDRDSLAPLPGDLLGRVDDRFQSESGDWIGIAGRATVVAYNTARLHPEDMPASLLEFGEPRWRTLIGWAPESEPFRMLLASLIAAEGPEAAGRWLANMASNRMAALEGDEQIVRAIALGEIAAGIVEHASVLRFTSADDPVAMHWPGRTEGYDPALSGVAGALVDVRGAAIAADTLREDDAAAFIAFLLSPEAQQLLSSICYEYPLVVELPGDPRLLPLSRIQTPAHIPSDPALFDRVGELLREHGLAG